MTDPQDPAQPQAEAAPAATPVMPAPRKQNWFWRLGTWLAGVDSAWRDSRSTAPLPLLRWTVALGVFVGLWIAGIPTHATGWICPGAIVALMILPDAGTLSVGGLKLEMLRQNKAEIEKVGEQVHRLQIQQAVAASATAGVVNNYYAHKAEAVAEVIQDADEGENSKAVSAEEVLRRFDVTAHPGSVTITPPSDSPDPESTLTS